MKAKFAELIVVVAVIAALTIPAAAQEKEKETGGKPAAAAVAPELATAPAKRADANTYIIGSEDVLSITVWKEPELSKTVPVRPDGKISLPLVGDIVASGQTPHQLQDSISSALGAYVAKPEVSVTVQEVRSQKFNIVGEVNKPGTYDLTRPMNVLDALALAGGLRDFANAKKIYVLRTNSDGTQTRLPFNYKQVIKGQNLSQNVTLQPRDTVVIP